MTVRALRRLLVLELVTFALVGIVIVDLHLHRRFEEVAGVNVRGYRGALQPYRAPTERRLLLVGDSTAFGYGVAWTESFAEYLAKRLTVERNRSVRRGVVRIINAAWLSDGAYALRYAVRDFARLAPDIVLVDAGYDALCEGCAGGRHVWRRESAVFRATGYMPMLPLYLREKELLLAHGSSPGRRAAARVYAVAALAVSAADRTTVPPLADVRGDGACGPRWSDYCDSIHGTVADALQHAKGVIVMTPPYVSDVHHDQQRAMAAMLEREFGADPRVVYLNQGHAVALSDPARTFDGVHLTALGNQELAESLVSPVGRLLDRW
jgi:lysophospholipase L1-like esterase